MGSLFISMSGTHSIYIRDDDIESFIEEELEEDNYRNKSHLVETAIKNMMEKKENNNDML
jgi:Arc/MetJ-type ribon-helix-helix transcriptional regulator